MTMTHTPTTPMPVHGSADGSPLSEMHDSETGYSALVHVPAAASSNVPLPLLVHLHGAGEAGSHVWGIVSEGQTGTPLNELHFGRACKQLANEFVVVGPQSPHSMFDTDKVSAFTANFLRKPPTGLTLDPNRVIIAGHSNGASAALSVAARGIRGIRPFAACVPCAPGGCRELEGLKGCPVWVFHGVNDVVLPVRCADQIVQTLRQINGSHDELLVRYTRIDNCPYPPSYPHLTGHGTPIAAFATDGIFEWMQEQSAQSRRA